MATLRTEITEIVTGLAMCGFPDVDRALQVRPRSVRNVTDDHFDRLDAARADGSHATEFTVAWRNGATFAASPEGLRGRPPWVLEWKGPHRPPGYEQVPADLRVDHVYLVSCKYGSNILLNASPAHLFDHRLVDRPAGRGTDWYLEVAPEAYQELYAGCRDGLAGLDAPAGDGAPDGLPVEVADLAPEDRRRLKQALRGGWPDGCDDHYRWFVNEVSRVSAERWRRGLRSAPRREEMVWRLLRLQAAPYFVLGAAPDSRPLSYRVGTPWDFRQAFELVTFDVWGESVGQPVVRWRADVRDRAADRIRAVEGHVEVRWSHGRFAQVPEAKVYLDTPHHQVPGYFPLDCPDPDR